MRKVRGWKIVFEEKWTNKVARQKKVGIHGMGSHVDGLVYL